MSSQPTLRLVRRSNFRLADAAKIATEQNTAISDGAYLTHLLATAALVYVVFIKYEPRGYLIYMTTTQVEGSIGLELAHESILPLDRADELLAAAADAACADLARLHCGLTVTYQGRAPSPAPAAAS